MVLFGKRVFFGNVISQDYVILQYSGSYSREMRGVLGGAILGYAPHGNTESQHRKPSRE